MGLLFAMVVYETFWADTLWLSPCNHCPFLLSAVAVLIGQIKLCYRTNPSNLMFNPLHVEAAKNLSINVLPRLQRRTLGAIGNMICPNNVVAVCVLVAILGREGK